MRDDWKSNGKAIASLALSCVSLICCIQWSISLALAVIAIVLGILGIRDENPNQEDAAIAGIVVGIVGFVLSILVAILYIRLTQHNPESAVAVLQMFIS